MEGRRIGRYVIGPDIAWGGMASVHLGRMHGPKGFGKTVALKCLHAQYARDPEFVKMFHDEARVTSGLTHANIVMTLDVIEETDALYLVMEYVHGASLAQIQKHAPGGKLPLRIALGIIVGLLDGLHAAHEARDELGEPLGIIHRDVSPQNVLVSFQGVPKIADFGIAKAAGRAHSTNDGSAKGKIAYMAPEMIMSEPVTPLADVYAAGVVLWEVLTGQRLIEGKSTADSLRAVLDLAPAPPSKISPEVPPEVDAVVLRALARDPKNRFASAKEMSTALSKAVDVAHAAEISDWLKAECGALMAQREKSLTELQRALGMGSGTRIGVGVALDGTSEADSSKIGANEQSGDSSSHYVAEKIGLPPKLPRWVGPAAVSALLALGALLFVMLSGRHATPARNTAANAVPSSGSAASVTALGSVPPAVGPTVPGASVMTGDEPSTALAAASAVTSTSAAAPTDTKVKAVSATPSAHSTSERVVSSSAPAPVPVKPRPSMGGSVPNPKRKCRIVTSTDSAGHTTFSEVCE